jgi:hypothetical protein
MIKNYTKITTLMGNIVIQYEEDGVLYTIPLDPANSDYQQYLKWLEEQNG